ncbi:MAG: DUF5320 domain-containing protein, partial [Nanoarchaeota archaeon]|nr:DUF5320 domain-containing protein [Nanoarchaeota archaeon]
MPNQDGTGPEGEGSMTGKCKGDCLISGKERKRNRRKMRRIK